MNMIEGRLSPHEAAAFLYATENSLRTMRSKGVGPPHHRDGRRVFYLEPELRAYVASLSPSATTQFNQRKALIEKYAIALVEKKGAPADRQERL